MARGGARGVAAQALRPLPAPVGPLGLLATFVGAQVCGGLLIGVVLGVMGAQGRGLSTWAVRLTYDLSSLVLLAATLLALRLARLRAEALGGLWRWPGAGALLLGLGAGLVLKLGGDLAAVLQAPLLGPVRGNNPLVLHPTAFASPLLIAGLVVAVVVVAPVAEELFFRGLLYGWLRARLPVPAAVAIAAVLFSVAHFQPGLLLPLAVVGAGLCLLYERSRSLWVPAAAHAALNAGSLLLALWLR